MGKESYVLRKLRAKFFVSVTELSIALNGIKYNHRLTDRSKILK